MNQLPLKVCLAIPSFDRLGAQRVALWLARGFDRRRVSPYFLVHHRTGDMAEIAPADVPVVEVDRFCPRIPRLKALTRLFGYTRALAAHPPDVAIGVVQYPTLALAYARARLRASWGLLACEHSYVSKNLADREAYGWLFRTVYRRSFPRVYNRVCDRVVVTAEEGRDDLVRNWGVRLDKLVVIPNPLDAAEVRQKAAEPLLADPWLPEAVDAPLPGPPVVAAAGRLVLQKRFDILIQALGRLRRRRAVRLVILGHGEREGDLRSLSRELGLAEVVRIENKSPPWQFMARSSLFALSSEWEGFPMVLGEAMALGCRIVSVACPSGPAEMLESGKGGVLVTPGDPQALAEGLAFALDHPEDMRQRAEAARRKSTSYDVSVVAERYATLVEEIGRSRPANAAG